MKSFNLCDLDNKSLILFYMYLDLYARPFYEINDLKVAIYNTLISRGR